MSINNIFSSLGLGKKNEENAFAGDTYNNEVCAAIATAFQAYSQDMNSVEHDVEDTVLTIQKVSRNYSPWSSKIYTLRETPLKK